MIKFIYESNDSDETLLSSEVIIDSSATIPELCDALLKFIATAGYMVDICEDKIVYYNASKAKMGLDRMQDPEYVGNEYQAYTLGTCDCKICAELNSDEE